MTEPNAEPKEKEQPSWYQDIWRISDYYKGLVVRGVPEHAALALSLDYQRMVLSRDVVPANSVEPTPS